MIVIAERLSPLQLYVLQSVLVEPSGKLCTEQRSPPFVVQHMQLATHQASHCCLVEESTVLSWVVTRTTPVLCASIQASPCPRPCAIPSLSDYRVFPTHALEKL